MGWKWNNLGSSLHFSYFVASKIKQYRDLNKKRVVVGAISFFVAFNLQNGVLEMPCEPIKDKEIIKNMMESLSMRQNGLVYNLYFEFALSTALRVSDILSLRKKDIKDGMVRIKTQKTGLFKKIELNPSCRRKMDMYLQYKKDDDLIFPFKRQWVHKLMKYAADSVGISSDNVSCHTTRKTCAYWVYKESGNDINKTMKLLGHKDPKITREYLLIDDDEVNEELVSISWS